MNQYPILSPCTKFELNWSRMKKVRENLIFDGESKLEIMSYSDNAYDVTNFFGCFETFLAYSVFLASFIVLRHQLAELTWGKGAFCLPLSNIGCAQTPSKTGLSALFCSDNYVDFTVLFFLTVLYSLLCKLYQRIILVQSTSSKE